MGLAVSIIKNEIFGTQRVVIADITFDSAYVTGGEPLDFKLLGLTQINFMQLPAASGYQLEYDYANKKIKARTPVSAIAAHSHTENTAASYTQNATTATAGAITAAAAGEVANATNLSTLVVRVMIYGY